MLHIDSINRRLEKSCYFSLVLFIKFFVICSGDIVKNYIDFHFTLTPQFMYKNEDVMVFVNDGADLTSIFLQNNVPLIETLITGNREVLSGVLDYTTEITKDISEGYRVTDESPSSQPDNSSILIPQNFALVNDIEDVNQRIIKTSKVTTIKKTKAKKIYHHVIR